MSKIFKNRMPLSVIMALGFLISFMTHSFIHSSGGSEETTESDSNLSESTNADAVSQFAAFPEDMTAIKTTIDEYFTKSNSNISEKIIKSVHMQLKEETGMKIEVILDRNLVNKAINGAYVYDNGKVQFKTENTSPTGKATLVTKENIDSISRYILSKLFAYDTEKRIFQIVNPEVPDYKGITSYIQSVKINDDPQITNLESLEPFMNFFMNTKEQTYQNILVGGVKEEAEKKFLIDWQYLIGTNPNYPVILGYYSQAVFTNTITLQTIMNHIYTLEGITYPAHNDNDNIPAQTTPEVNANFFTISFFIMYDGVWRIYNLEQFPEISLQRGLQDYTGSIAKASVQRLLDSLSYQSSIPASGDLSFTFSINTENLFKALGATEKYKGITPSAG